MLRQLEKEYDLFFAGQLKAEPFQTSGEVQKLFKLYMNRPFQNAGWQFKFNSLVSRHTALRTVWTRRLRERERGSPR